MLYDNFEHRNQIRIPLESGENYSFVREARNNVDIVYEIQSGCL